MGDAQAEAEAVAVELATPVCGVETRRGVLLERRNPGDHRPRGR